MVDARTTDTPSAASPATDGAVRETEVLAGLTRLALEMARSFQAQSVAALASGDLGRAGKAEGRFSSLFLAIRRVVALNAKLRRQRQDAAASPLDEAAMLSELMALAEALAIGFQALCIAALDAGDLDRGGDAETHFSSLFLGIRRAIALKIKLREQRAKAQREAERQRESRQREKDDRRQAVAQGVAQAIAAAPDADAKERLTVDLWEKLTEDERIDVDLADTALPIEALIASLCRALGLPPYGPGGAGPAGTGKAGPKRGPAGGARGTSGPPGDQHGASGTTAAGPERPEAAEAAPAPPWPVPPPAARGRQGGVVPPATAPPGEAPAKGREHDRRRLAA